jgi:fatty-acid desaturase
MESLKTSPRKTPASDSVAHEKETHDHQPHFSSSSEPWNESNGNKPALSKRGVPLLTAKRTEVTERRSHGINWPTTIWLVIVHLGALAAPFTFTWQALVMVFVLHWLTGGIGICLGFHRFLTHGSFQTYRPVKWFLGFLGMLAGEGSAIDWVANHRKHHALSDQEGDPHSPRDGAWWSHALWIS